MKKELQNFKEVSLYTPSFLKNFRALIESYKKIKSPTIDDLIKLNDDIKLYSKASSLTFWKDCENVFNSSEFQIANYNKKFNKKIAYLLQEKNSRKNSVNFLNQLHLAITIINMYLYLIDSEIKLLSIENINEIIDNLNKDFFFILVIDSVFLKTQKNYLALNLIEELDYSNSSTYNKSYILSTDLYYTIIDNLIKKLILEIINYYSKNNKKKDNHLILKSFSKNLYYKKLRTENSIINISKQLEEIFQKELFI